MDPSTPEPQQCRIALSQNQVDDLRSEMIRTGVGATAIMRLLKPVPDGLTGPMISSWINQGITARLDHFNAVRDALRALPDAATGQRTKTVSSQSPTRISLTQDRLRTLQDQIERTGMPLKTFLRLNKASRPVGLTYAVATNWLRGQIKTARRDYFAFVMEGYEQFPDIEKKPDAPPNTRIRNGVAEVEISQGMIKQLFQLQEKSGLNPRQLLADRSDCPDGLDHFVIHRWMARKTRWAIKSHYDYVCALWEQALKSISPSQSP